MSLGLSQLSSQLSSVGGGGGVGIGSSSQIDQSQTNSTTNPNPSPVDILRLGNNSRTPQLFHHDHHSNNNLLMGTSLFRPSHHHHHHQTLPSSSFFLHHHPQDSSATAPDHHHHHGSGSGSGLHHHNLIQVSPHHDHHQQQQHNNSNNVFNLSFFPTNSNMEDNTTGSGSGSGSAALLHHHIQNPFNNANSGNNNNNNNNEGSSIFSTGSLVIGDHMTSSIPSLFSTAGNNTHPTTPHMSATALLQKAAQLGSTTSNNHLHELVNSITAAGSVGGSNSNIFGYEEDGSDHQYGTGGGGGGNKLSFDHALSIGEGLTRDFLGVGPAGELVRTVSGQRSESGAGGTQQHSMGMIRALDSERKTAHKSQSFGGSVNFQ